MKRKGIGDENPKRRREVEEEEKKKGKPTDQVDFAFRTAGTRTITKSPKFPKKSKIPREVKTILMILFKERKKERNVKRGKKKYAHYFIEQKIEREKANYLRKKERKKERKKVII